MKSRLFDILNFFSLLSQLNQCFYFYSFFQLKYFLSQG